MEIHFHFEAERANTLKVGQLRAIERMQEGEPAKLNTMIPIMAHFMLNGTGYLAQDKAEAALDDLTGEQLAQVVEQFTQQMRTDAVPLANAPQSPEQSTVMDEARPVGATP